MTQKTRYRANEERSRHHLWPPRVRAHTAHARTNMHARTCVFLTFHQLSEFPPVAVTRDPGRKQLGKKGLILVHISRLSFISTGKSQQQGLEAAGQSHSAEQKRNECTHTCLLVGLFVLSLRAPFLHYLGNGATHRRLGIPTAINLMKTPLLLTSARAHTHTNTRARARSQANPL